MNFETKRLPTRPDLLAPDGSNVRLLLSLGGGSMAHFELQQGHASRPVAHRTVDEIWYFTDGRGEMWRLHGDQEEVIEVESGLCLTIPVGTSFQFRATGSVPLEAIAVTMPPWPGATEAYEVAGKWSPILRSQNAK